MIDRLSVHYSKRGKSSIGSLKENNHGPDKENVDLINIEEY